MLQKMQDYTGIIRERGQLTIPMKVRRKLTWLQTDASVHISVQENMLCISQPQRQPEKLSDAYWQQLRKKIALARSFGYAGSVVQNIRSDRDRDHR